MRKRFQLIISVSILAIMLAGSFSFSGISRRFMNQRLTKQVVMDNKVLGKEILEKTITDWPGDQPQVDDITVMGIRITPQLTQSRQVQRAFFSS